MKLSDLPRGQGFVSGAIEVIVSRFCPAGTAYSFTDGKLVVRALDDNITEVKEVPYPLRAFRITTPVFREVDVSTDDHATAVRYAMTATLLAPPRFYVGIDGGYDDRTARNFRRVRRARARPPEPTLHHPPGAPPYTRARWRAEVRGKRSRRP